MGPRVSMISPSAALAGVRQICRERGHATLV